jgi:hypothetical protein
MDLLTKQISPVFCVLIRILQMFRNLESFFYCDFCNFFKVSCELCDWFCRFHDFITKLVESPNIFYILTDFNKKAPANILIALTICMNLVVKMVLSHPKYCLFFDNFDRIEVLWQKRVIIPWLFSPIIMHFFSLGQFSFWQQFLARLIKSLSFEQK